MQKLKKFKHEEDIYRLQDEFLACSPKEFVENITSGNYAESLLKDSLFFSEESVALPYIIKDPERTKGDFKNAVKLFEALRHLDLDEANDPRLWIYLSTKCYPDYISQRHNVDKKDQIKKQFFFGSGSATSNVRNAISKLWWGVKQTIREDEEDKKKRFLYTKMYFDKTDIVMHIGERKDVFKNKELVRAILDVAYKKPASTATTVKILAKFMLNHIKLFNIDFMSYEELVSLAESFYTYSSRFRPENPKHIKTHEQILSEIEF